MNFFSTSLQAIITLALYCTRTLANIEPCGVTCPDSVCNITYLKSLLTLSLLLIEKNLL